MAILKERNLQSSYDEARFALFCKHIALQKSVQYISMKSISDEIISPNLKNLADWSG
jgi:hypothetical protein